uniref:Uncharacterized protein n=1 Tax=Anguilla anguilla TaxID=7936 RepID=A0A0E9WES4_ANGAN
MSVNLKFSEWARRMYETIDNRSILLLSVLQNRHYTTNMYERPHAANRELLSSCACT